tara:strand:- start:3053 stop:3832 length:780 start_codon:yes stop_codon:yes gene_type:complete
LGRNKGFVKEREIISILNQKIFKDLDPAYKKEISKMCPGNINLEDELTCSKNEGSGLEKKTDLTLEIKKQKINMSVKIGTGNSVHQEPIDRFVKFLQSQNQLSQNQIDLIYEFHWCDGTFDNSGSVSSRKKKNDYAKSNRNRHTTYVDILRSYKKEIFTRVMLGTVNSPNYLLYFETFENKRPHFMKMNDLLEKHMAPEEAVKSIGIFNVQNCWPCLKGQDHGHKTHKCSEGCPKKIPRTQKHRHDVQFKVQNFGEYIL